MVIVTDKAEVVDELRKNGIEVSVIGGVTECEGVTLVEKDRGKFRLGVQRKTRSGGRFSSWLN